MKLTAIRAVDQCERTMKTHESDRGPEPTSAALPTGSKHSEEFLEETVRVWQKYYDRPLTHDDARQIIENVTGYFRLLRDMERRSTIDK